MTLAEHSSKSVEWYTPVEYIGAIQSVLGYIDLDPASSHEANRVVEATHFYTKADDGLTKDWAGRVFLNPPYGRGIDKWVSKLRTAWENGEVDSSILLVNAATSAGWFQKLWGLPMCFPRKRIKFWRPGGAATRPTHSSVFVLFSDRTDEHEAFKYHFGEFGFVVEYQPKQ